MRNITYQFVVWVINDGGASFKASSAYFLIECLISFAIRNGKFIWHVPSEAIKYYTLKGKVSFELLRYIAHQLHHEEASLNVSQLGSFTIWSEWITFKKPLIKRDAAHQIFMQLPDWELSF